MRISHSSSLCYKHGGTGRPMKSRICIFFCGYHLHRRASVVCVCLGRGDSALLFPLPTLFSQLIPVVFQQRRLYTELLVPRSFSLFTATEEPGDRKKSWPSINHSILSGCKPELVFLNVYGAPESMSRNEFRQPM
jgi:hypothetical protein